MAAVDTDSSSAQYATINTTVLFVPGDKFFSLALDKAFLLSLHVSSLNEPVMNVTNRWLDYTVLSQANKAKTFHAMSTSITFKVAPIQTAYSLSVQVFRVGANGDKRIVTTSIGVAQINIHELTKAREHSIEVTDCDGEVCGKLKLSDTWVVSRDNAALNRILPVNSELQATLGGIDALADRMVEYAYRRQKAHGTSVDPDKNDRFFFKYFTTPGTGRSRELPLLAFVALSRMLSVNTIKSSGPDPMPEKPLKLFNWWADIATLLFTMPYNTARANSYDKMEDAERKANVLTEFLTLMIRSMVYTLDSVRRGGWADKPVLTDQWMQILSFPAYKRKLMTGFDCEDGALLVMQIFTVLCGIDPTDADVSKDLRSIIETALEYRPFFCIGEMKSYNDTYEAHAFVVLLHKLNTRDPWSGHADKVQQALSEGKMTELEAREQPIDWDMNSDLFPNILVESTMYQNGAWTVRAMRDTDAMKGYDREFRYHEPASWPIAFPRKDNADDVAFEKVVNWGESLGSSDASKANKRLVKIKTNPVNLFRDSMYSRVFLMITPVNVHGAPVAQYEQYLVKQDGKFGGNLFDLLLGRQALNLDERDSTGIQFVCFQKVTVVKDAKTNHMDHAAIDPAHALLTNLDLYYLLRGMPLAKLPHPPGAAAIGEAKKQLFKSAELSSGDNACRYVTREAFHEESKVKKCIERFALGADGRSLVEEAVIPLTDTAAFVLYTTKVD